MDSNLLKIFVAVAEKKSITLGAKLLKVTQTNVSLRIKQLEKNLGFELFHRVPKGVILTKEGEKLLPFAIEIVNKIKQAQLQVKNIKKQDSLVIASTFSNAAIRLLPFLKRLNTDYPEIELELITDNTIPIKQMLFEYKVDIAFVNHKPNEEEFIVLKKYDNELLFAESKNKNKNNVLIAHEASCAFFNSAKQYCEHLDNNEYDTLELADFEVMLACVELGMGKTVLPKSIIEKYGYLDKLKTTTLDKKLISVSTYLICRKDNQPKTINYKWY